MNRYHVLVLKKNVHKPGHFQYAIHYEGKSFSCQRTQKGFTSYYMHFSSFKICSQILFLVSAILHHISLLRLLPKSYFKISTFQSNFLCSSSFKRYMPSDRGHKVGFMPPKRRYEKIEVLEVLLLCAFFTRPDRKGSL